MTSLEHLLPAPDEIVRCADHGRRIALDPGGTAIRADRFVVVDTPLPWPKPVFAHTQLDGVRDALVASPVTTRVLAAVPVDTSNGSGGGSGDGSSSAGERVGVAVYDRASGDGATEWHAVSHAAGLADLAAAVAATPVGGCPSTGPGVFADDRPVAMERPVVLVCTQGSHDVCCGSDGARFAAEVEAMGADIVVRRVSHTGGHRFAPTLVTLPDGRMWADADLDLLRQVLWRTGHPSEVTDRCRGWWGAETGPAQVAERAVLAAAGWAVEPTDRSVAVQVDPDDDRIRCVVTADDRRWEVIVSPGREVPTIGCRVPGGLPAKTRSEHAVDSVVEQH